MQFAHEKKLISQIFDFEKNKSAQLCVTKHSNAE